MLVNIDLSGSAVHPAGDVMEAGRRVLPQHCRDLREARGEGGEGALHGAQPRGERGETRL